MCGLTITISSPDVWSSDCQRILSQTLGSAPSYNAIIHLLLLLTLTNAQNFIILV